MPAPDSPEFRQRAVEPTRVWERPVAEIARSLRISESFLRNWMAQVDVDAGDKPGLTSDERNELAELWRDKLRLKLKDEISNWAAAYFAGENVLPKPGLLHLAGSPHLGVRAVRRRRARRCSLHLEGTRLFVDLDLRRAEVFPSRTGALAHRTPNTPGKIMRGRVRARG